MRIFVYGTLLDPAVFRRVTGTAPPPLRPARLDGWKRVRLARHPYPTLLPDPRGRVRGAVLRVRPPILARLHRYEGPLYRFVPVTVRRGRKHIAASAWIARRHVAAPRLAWRP